jgi:CubicO group peptidase (beta-lactamase class C family)
MNPGLRCKRLLRLASKHVFLLFFISFSVHAVAQVSKQKLPAVNGRAVYAGMVNSKVESLMKEAGVAGVSLALLDKNGIYFYNTYGYKNLDKKKKEKINKETIFEACSMSKSFVVFAAYKMVDKGLLDLDKPLYQYLENDELKYDERYKLITARMVLSHTSGLENHKEKNNPDTLELIDDPAKEYHYSGEGYVYLSNVIAKLVNKPVGGYLQEMVYDPLGLRRTYTTCVGKGNENYASGHSAFGEDLNKERNTYPDVTGRLHTNAQDYAKLLTGLFGRKELSEKSLQTLLTPVVKIRPNGGLYYGAGFEVLITPENDTILLQGGDNNGYKGLGCYSIVHKTGFVFYANSERAESIVAKLCEMTVGLDISLHYEDGFRNMYPNTANSFFSLYKEKGATAVKNKFDEMMAGPDAAQFTGKDILDVIYHFRNKEYNTAKYMAAEYEKRNPDFPGNKFFKRMFKD